MTRGSDTICVTVVHYARVAELADAQDLGSCVFGVGVRVPPLALMLHYRRGSVMQILAVVFLALLVSACEGDSSQSSDLGPMEFIIPISDQGVTTDNHGNDAVSPLDEGSDTAVQDAEFADTNHPDLVGEDTPLADLHEIDSNQPDSNIFTDQGQPDEGQPDEGPGIDTYEPPVFCRSMLDCNPGYVCDFSMGRCEARGQYIAYDAKMLDYHSPVAGIGDLVVMDGERFWPGGMVYNMPYADIDKFVVTNNTANAAFDENRLVGEVPRAATDGVVSVVFNNASPVYRHYTTNMTIVATGVLECDSTTPAQGNAGSVLGMTGPYGAAYVDFATTGTRVFYPGECGSVRKPAIPGQYPLVFTAQDSLAGYIQFEYIGQMLASWGFVVVLTNTPVDSEDEKVAPQTLLDRVKEFMGQDLSSKHPALAGISTDAAVSFVALGDGVGRIKDMLNLDDKADKVVVGKIKGMAGLGPLGGAGSLTMPSVSAEQSMIFGATRDAVSPTSKTDSFYDKQNSPKYKIIIAGGNHGGFCDHKVFIANGVSSSTDYEPQIDRAKQLRLVLDFVVPFMQRVNGLDVTFPAQLDSVTSSSDFTITKSL